MAESLGTNPDPMKLDSFPPIVCRLLARPPSAKAKSQRPLTDREIAVRSGLRLDQVLSLSWLCTWENVPVDIMLRFSRACGIYLNDYQNIQKHYRLVSRMAGRWLTGKHYLRRDPAWDVKWKPLVETWIAFVQWEERKKKEQQRNADPV